MAEKKHSVLALLEILRKYSDEDHILSLKEIQRHLENEYGTVLDRRTIYTNLDILEDFGYEISDFEDNGKGYFLVQREFDKGEILLLANAVHASHFISANQSASLINRLLETQSRYVKADFKDKVFMPNPVKTMKRQLLYNLETVSDAIRDSRQLQFKYLRYDSRKKPVPRREEPYIVEPRYIVYADARPYMIVTSENHPGFIHYRIDRMADARILTEKSRPLPKRSDPYDYARNKLFMYSGDTETVSFRCRNEVMDHMIDIFGPELTVLPEDGEHFRIRVKVPAQGALYLAQQFMDSITIMEPEDLKEEFKAKLREVRKRYA
ncbi:MAG: WYL domain-containing transcriptional regulator [Erysipelotrichaceae bacterium]|nr:WYL domain-containing transcriptional regulator [Erysipelotrichaceae bacterium]